MVSDDIRIFCNVALVPNLANNTLFIMILCEILGVLIAKIRATHEDEVIDMVTYPPIFVRSGLRPLVTLLDFTK